MSQELRLAVFGGVLPGLLTGVALLAAWLLWSRRLDREAHSAANIPDSIRARPHFGPVWVAPVVLTLGYLGADFATNGLIQRWPDSNTYRFPHAALLLGLVGLLEALTPGVSTLRTVVITLARTAALAGGAWMLVQGYHESGAINDTTFYGTLALVALGGTWVITLADLGASAASARVVGPLVAIVGGACIPLLLRSGYALVAQSSTAFVAWGVAAALAAWIVWLYGKRRGIGENARVVMLHRGGMTVFAGLLVLHAVGVRFHTYPAPHDPLGLPLIAFAPAAFAVLAWRQGPTDSDTPAWHAGKSRIVLTLALVLTTLAAAALPILLDQPSETPGASEYDDYYAD